MECHSSNSSFLVNRAGNVSILIATANRSDLINHLYNQIIRDQSFSLIEQIVIINNGKEELSLVNQKHNTKIISYKCDFKSKALNVGLSHITTKYIIFFDDDVELDPFCITSYIEAFKKYPENSYYGGVSQTKLLSPLPKSICQILPTCIRGLNYKQALGYSKKNIFFIGLNWAAQKIHLIDAGGFNEQLGPGQNSLAAGQEREMQLKLNKQKVRGIWIPNAVVTHTPNLDRSTLKWWYERRVRTGGYCILGPEPVTKAFILDQIYYTANFIKALLMFSNTIKLVIYYLVGQAGFLLGLLKAKKV